jgi:hypothetical protein
MALCGECKNPTRRDEEGLECGKCDEFYHAECGKIGRKALLHYKGPNMKGVWKCTECKISEMCQSKIEEMKEKYKNEIEEVKKEMKR